MTQSGTITTKRDPQLTMGNNQRRSHWTAYTVKRKRYDPSNRGLILKKGLLPTDEHDDYIAGSCQSI